MVKTDVCVGGVWLQAQLHTPLNLVIISPSLRVRWGDVQSIKRDVAVYAEPPIKVPLASPPQLFTSSPTTAHRRHSEPIDACLTTSGTLKAAKKEPSLAYR